MISIIVMRMSVVSILYAYGEARRREENDGRRQIDKGVVLVLKFIISVLQFMLSI